MDLNIAKDKYQAALDRAHAEHLEARVSDSLALVLVTSSDGTGCYTVDVGPFTTSCNCKAGMNGLYCKHRALAKEAIARRAQPAPEAPAKGWLEMTRAEQAAFLARGIFVAE